jgi:hypothetical protein
MFSWQSIFTVRIFFISHHVEVTKISDVLEELSTYSFKTRVGGIQDYV